LAGLGILGTELDDRFVEVDVNPMIADPQGCVTVGAPVTPGS